MSTEQKLFNNNRQVAEGWYWSLPSKKLKKGKVLRCNILGFELAVFRSVSGCVTALDAYCPHMGAHLAEGKVEGETIRCFFHNWQFDNQGNCKQIPCLKNELYKRVQKIRTWPVKEKYGLIWIWCGEQEPTIDIPVVPELPDGSYDSSLGNSFTKNCHPNVMMINAIDEQHFHTVHRLPGSILSMDPEPKTTENIVFENSGQMPKGNWLGKFLSKFYADKITYNLSYWYGSVGTVTLGPDFLHLYLMFTLRLCENGKTQGRTIALTRKRKGFFGWIFNRFILGVTKIAGYYFATGDSRVFRTIKFKFNTPITNDKAIIFFIEHLERQPAFTTNYH